VLYLAWKKIARVAKTQQLENSEVYSGGFDSVLPLYVRSAISSRFKYDKEYLLMPGQSGLGGYGGSIAKNLLDI